MTGSAISVVAQPCLRVNPRHVNRDIAAMPSRGVGRAASQRRAFARDTIPLGVYASGSPIIHRRNRRSVRRLIWPGTPSLLAMAQPQPLSCCHRFGQASIQASASYSFMERTSLCHSGRRPAARIRAKSEGGHESEKSQRGHRVRQPASTQFKALRLDTKYENPHVVVVVVIVVNIIIMAASTTTVKVPG